MKEARNELIYLGIMTTLMIVANLFLRTTPAEDLKQYAQFVPIAIIFIFLGHFFIRGHMLRRKFSKYLVYAPFKPYHYKRNYVMKAANSGVFYFGEMFSVWVIAMSIFIIGFGMGDDDFEKLQVWETMASFGVFPFLGQIMPILMKWDELHHKESQEKAGLYYESY